MPSTAKWYKIQVHTFDSGEGKTNAAVFFRFWDNLIPITPPLSGFDYKHHGSLQCDSLSLTAPQNEITNLLQIDVENGMPWLKLNSLGDSHERGDDDIYYFVLTGIEGRLTNWDKRLVSHTKHDAWTYELVMFVWNDNAWKQVFRIPKRTSRVDEGAGKPNSLQAPASCHIYADKRIPPKIVGERFLPTGVVVNEVTPAQY